MGELVGRPVKEVRRAFELLLHVGPEKTGTTTVQTSLAASAPALTAAGTFVPLAAGHSPGHHLPILREVVGEHEFQARYAYSQDSLSLEATLAELSANRCPRMLLSAEDFSSPATRPDVLRLLERINPARVTVIHAVRPVVPWLLSWHGQDIKFRPLDRGPGRSTSSPAGSSTRPHHGRHRRPLEPGILGLRLPDHSPARWPTTT